MVASTHTRNENAFLSDIYVCIKSDMNTQISTNLCTVYKFISRLLAWLKEGSTSIKCSDRLETKSEAVLTASLISSTRAPTT